MPSPDPPAGAAVLAGAAPAAPGTPTGASGIVFDIQRYSIHDGPGIRTVVFLKGCPLRCQWCANPEGIARPPQVWFFADRCEQCGACLAACPEGAVNADLAAARAGGWRIDRARCTDCGACAEACPHGGLRVAGRTMTVEDVLEVVERDRPFYRRSGGGLTLSGGEPLAQPVFAAALLAAARGRGLHTAVETCGLVAPETLARVLPLVDVVLLDVKHLDDAVHRAMTGAPNAPVLRTARAVGAAGVRLLLRVPLVPGVNADPAHLGALAGFAREVGAAEVHLMPFHQLGQAKYRRLDLPYALAGRPGLEATPEGRLLLARARALLEEAGLRVLVGG